VVNRHRIKLNVTPSDFARSFAEFETLNKATWCIKDFVDLNVLFFLVGTDLFHVSCVA
jgi:hypothetical protein